MASVYLARDETLGRRVAVKVLEALAGDGELRDRFLREARLAARLSHPNVVSVFDVGEQDGAPYIVMEYVEGETLAELLARRGPLPPEEAAELGRQAAAGLQHAHEAGLVHRDVKPQNLLVARDGTLKISDFGIARATEATRVTAVGTILGTAGYLAPEQATGEAAGPPADVYGLGAVLYETLAGRPPVVVESLAELATAHERPPEPLRALAPDTPPELERTVMRALARRPQERPQSARELGLALGDTTLEAAPPTLVLPRRRHGRRELAWAAAAALVVAVVAGVALVAGDGEAPPAVEPVPRHVDAEQQARALAAWLRENAGGG